MAITTRDYDNYEDYLEHQKEKTGCPKRRERLNAAFEDRKNYFLSRFKTYFKEEFLAENKNVKVVCLGSRMGEEVAALQEIGFEDCIGTDLIARDPYVIVDDFHNMSFESDTVGIFYTNSLDHSCKPKQMFEEVYRCLKPGGIFIIDFFPGHMGRYEACKIDSIEDLIPAMPIEMKFVQGRPTPEFDLAGQSAHEIVFKKSE